MIKELIIPSFTNRMGYTMADEPIMVLASDVTVLSEDYVLGGLEDLRVLTLCLFYVSVRNLFSSISTI